MIILASASPRRKEILSLLDIEFDVIPAGGEIGHDSSLPPEESVKCIAIFKAEEIAKKYPDDIIIGADTSVLYNGNFFGKPKDKKDAERMLKQLSGKTHKVLTAVCIINGGEKNVFCETAEVTFQKLSACEIEEYIASGEPMDKAGAYGIQGRGAKFVKGINGDFYTVMGLPCARLYCALKAIDAI